jgi:hypothetical protein
LKPPRFSFGEFETELSVQIFGSVASSRSQLEGAMRNSRQRRCSAAISPTLAARLRKRLQSSLNRSSAVPGAAPAADHPASACAADGIGFKHKLPDA